MKNLWRIIIISCICCIIGTTFYFITNAESSIDVYEEEIAKEQLNTYYKFDHIEILQIDNNYYIKSKTNLEKLEFNVKDCLNDQKYIYIISDTSLYRINKDNLKIKEATVKMLIVNSICKFNDQIIIGGSLNENLYIGIYDNNLELIDELYLEGDGEQTCIEVRDVDDSLYVLGTKDAHSNNRYFKNVGNKNDIKSFVFRVDEDLNIINEIYFNEDYSIELIKEIKIFDEYLLFSIETKDCTYIYYTDYYLNAFKKTLLKETNVDIIETSKKDKNELVYVKKNIDEFFIKVKTDNESIILKNFEGNILNKYLEKGQLVIIYTSNERTYMTKISEYHINFIYDLVCNYFGPNINSQEHFSIESYFENLVFEADNMNNIESNMFGEYEISYKCTRLNKEIIGFQTKLIIRPYVNIRQNGIYKNGTRIYFSGKGYLNNEEVFNGTALNKLGENTFKIVGNNNDEISYKFYIVDDYYKDASYINFETDYVITRGDKIYIKIDNNIKCFKNNNSEIGNICILNDEKFWCISSQNDQIIQQIKVDEVTLESGRTIKYDYSITLKVKKINPVFKIYEYKNDDKCYLQIMIDDALQCLDNIYISVDDGTTKKTYNTFLKSQQFILNDLEVGKNYEICINSIDENNQATVLFTYIGELSKKENFTFDFDFVFDEECLTKINCIVDLSSSHQKINKLFIGNDQENNLNQKYQVTESYLFAYVSIGISILLVIIIIIIIFKKKPKSKNDYS